MHKKLKPSLAKLLHCRLDRRKLRFVVDVLLARFDKVGAATRLVGVARNQLYMVVIGRSVAHRTQVNAYTTVHIANYAHKSLGKPYDFGIKLVGSFGHILKMLDCRYAHMSVRAWIAYKEHFDVLVTVHHLVAVVAKHHAAMRAIETRRANTHVI